MDAFGVRGWGVGLCVFFFRVSCSCHCPMQALRVQNYSWWGFKLYLIRIPKYAKKNNLQRICLALFYASQTFYLFFLLDKLQYVHKQAQFSPILYISSH